MPTSRRDEYLPSAGQRTAPEHHSTRRRVEDGYGLFPFSFYRNNRRTYVANTPMNPNTSSNTSLYSSGSNHAHPSSFRPTPYSFLAFSSLQSSLTVPITQCEGGEQRQSNHGQRPLSAGNECVGDHSAANEIRTKWKHEEESCPTCLWTGVATCTGLSVYFGSIAQEEWIKHLADTTFGRKGRRIPWNAAIFGGVAVGWVAIGIYRYQLG